MHRRAGSTRSAKSPENFKQYAGLEMGLLGFQNRPVSGPETFNFCDLNGPNPVQNPFKMVGREAPHHFEWVLDRVRAV